MKQDADKGFEAVREIAINILTSMAQEAGFNAGVRLGYRIAGEERALEEVPEDRCAHA